MKINVKSLFPFLEHEVQGVSSKIHFIGLFSFKSEMIMQKKNVHFISIGKWTAELKDLISNMDNKNTILKNVQGFTFSSHTTK